MNLEYPLQIYYLFFYRSARAVNPFFSRVPQLLIILVSIDRTIIERAPFDKKIAH